MIRCTSLEKEQRQIKWGVFDIQWYIKDLFLRYQVRHEGVVCGVIFSKDESLILTWSGNETHLWHLRADYDFPKDSLPLLVEVVTGTVMDDLGNVTVLKPEAWQERKKQYIEIAEKHLKTCQYKDANIYVSQKQFWEGGKETFATEGTEVTEK